MRPAKVGDLVLFRLDSGPNQDQLRPAIIVRTWGPPPSPGVQLQVFTDATNDGLQAVEWRTSCLHGDAPGQWLFPEEAP